MASRARGFLTFMRGRERADTVNGSMFDEARGIAMNIAKMPALLKSSSKN